MDVYHPQFAACSLLAEAGTSPLQPFQWLVIAGLGLACFFLLRGARQRLFGQDTPAAPPVLSLREKHRDLFDAEPPVEVLRWQVQMHDLARDLKGDLDTKHLALQALLQQVRVERAELERLLAEARRERQGP
jgi:hypothetical protein